MNTAELERIELPGVTWDRTEKPKKEFFRTGYLDRALTDLDTVLKEAEHLLRHVDFDTLVGTGFSGALVVPALALRMGKEYVLVRKPNDGSHHSGRLIGNLGERWVFVDDFVSSGSTRQRVLGAIDDCASKREHLTYYVGDYLYAKARRNRFVPREDWEFEPVEIKKTAEEVVKDPETVIDDNDIVKFTSAPPLVAWKDLGFTEDKIDIKWDPGTMLRQQARAYCLSATEVLKQTVL